MDLLAPPRCQHCPNLADERSFMCERCAAEADAGLEVLRDHLRGVVEKRDRWKALAEAALDAVPQDHPDLGMWLVAYSDLGGQS
jgi:hypothetical protein